jgi:FixJ family two-component response regulator
MIFAPAGAVQSVVGTTLASDAEGDRLTQTPLISIVDDDEYVRVATCNLVQSLGYSACVFASAEEFLQSPRLHDTWCLIADVQMPGMSGIDLQTHLRDHGHRIAMIFITAFPDERVRARALEGGAVCFLNKPFDGRALVACLDIALRTHGGAADGD